MRKLIWPFVIGIGLVAAGYFTFATLTKPRYKSMYERCIESGDPSREQCQTADELFWGLGFKALESAKPEGSHGRTPL